MAKHDTEDSAFEERISKVNSLQKLEARGYGNNYLRELVPNLIKSGSEKIIQNDNGASIVLGRDRPASRLSGYGGRGISQCGTIDIVAGRMGSEGGAFDKQNSRIWVDPNFEKDAARIYISQKTDIDKNFNLVDGNVGESIGKSAIAVKADAVRLISREGIKLITKVDSRNSQGENNSQNLIGVDLIAANNDDDLQPLVKGKNLVESLKKMVFHLDKLNGIVDSLLMAQMTFNAALTHHFHFSPFFALPTTPSPTVLSVGIKTMTEHLMQTKNSLLMHKTNLVMFELKYFSELGGSNYINSRFHNCN